jgi:Ser/Thr protein kinase RdoA (MazF antagonist)
MSRHLTGPPALSVQDLLPVVAERFGLDAPICARRLTGGYANDVFLLEGPELVVHSPTFDRWRELISQARTDLIRLISDIDRNRPLAVGVTHNDIFPGNVLVQAGSVTAFLDWEEADVDWLVWDLASSVWPFCDQTDWRLSITEFVAAYRDGGGRVLAEDDGLILPLVRAKRILEVLRAPTDRHPRWDLQLANLEAYQALG